MSEHPACCRPTDSGLAVFVRLTPKSSRDALEGVGATDDGRSHIKARVRAAPEDGKANAALKKLLAKSFGIPASAVSLTSGATARLKTLELRGETAGLLARLEHMIGDGR